MSSGGPLQNYGNSQFGAGNLPASNLSNNTNTSPDYRPPQIGSFMPSVGASGNGPPQIGNFIPSMGTSGSGNQFIPSVSSATTFTPPQTTQLTAGNLPLANLQQGASALPGSSSIPTGGNQNPFQNAQLQLFIRQLMGQ